jgi:1-acyl-sn-glycerol-3-phosphate acyltransferase
MAFPELTLENAENVAAHVAAQKPNRALLGSLFTIASGVFRTETHYDVGAQKMIAEELNAGRQMLIAHDHQKFWDPIVLGVTVKREKTLRPILRNVVILGRSRLFTDPGIGLIVRGSGIVSAAYLKKDFPEAKDDPEKEALLRRANEASLDAMRQRMNLGAHGAIYPEGSRHETPIILDDGAEMPRDVTKLVLPLHAGIGILAVGLDRPENVSILPVGTVYGQNNDDIRHPVSVVGRPFPVAETVKQVVNQTSEELQFALSVAAEFAQHS